VSYLTVKCLSGLYLPAFFPDLIRYCLRCGLSNHCLQIFAVTLQDGRRTKFMALLQKNEVRRCYRHHVRQESS
ncbi:MAG TPA: hypothetical protein PLI89_13715, partial [Chitinophagales bacterium]|nr:hypothetical protein [Chitinophagales bacterium]